MKINILYLVWLVMLGVSGWLIYDFSNSAAIELFGTAETEGQLLNCEYPVLVKHINVRTGDAVRRGDTLLVLTRPELNKQSVLKSQELNQNQAEKQASAEDLMNKVEALTNAHHSKVNDLKTEIQVLEAEESAQSDLRKLVSNDNGDGKSLLANKIRLLEQSVRSEERQFAVQMKQLEVQKAAIAHVHDTRMASVAQEMTFMNEAQTKLILRAPMDGYIETVSVLENETATQYKGLVKINPRIPDKVKGFLPEASEALYRIGDTVQLRSSTRPMATSNGILVGTAPQLVELPLRLRKVQEVRAWGREVYIKLPPENDFFIGEKIMISLRNRTKSIQP